MKIFNEDGTYNAEAIRDDLYPEKFPGDVYPTKIKCFVSKECEETFLDLLRKPYIAEETK